jgi:hypothetical protein
MYSDGIKYLLGKPIYLEEHFTREKVNYDEFGNFGLLWKVNKTQSKCYITDDVHYTNIQKATSGIVFSGDKIREFDNAKIRFKGKSIKRLNSINTRDVEFLKRFNCSKWGVVTTIFDPPSEAVRRFLYRKNWCVVVVGDKGMQTEVRMFSEKRTIRGVFRTFIMLLITLVYLNMLIAILEVCVGDNNGRKYCFLVGK